MAGKDANTHDWRRQAIEEKIVLNEAQVEATRSHLQALEHQRYELLEALNSTSRIMTVLSPEVLSEILLLACELQFSTGLYSRPPQFRFGRVCKAWRRIAWSTPKLWCSVGMRFAPKRYETQRVLLENWIKRSASCPLTITLDLKFYDHTWEPPFDSTFQFLATTCHRWKELDTFAFTSLARALEQCPPRFPLLEKLRIFSPRTLTDRNLAKWNFSSATPRLHCLTILRHTPGPGLGVAWERLTILRMAVSFRFLPSFEVLSLAPSLKTLLCNVTDYTSSFNPNMVPALKYPQLSSLTINGQPRLVVSLLQLITAPELTDLDLSCDHPSSPVMWTNAVVELVQRSACKLVNLYIFQNNLTSEDLLLDMLKKISPTLEAFCLECPAAFTLSDRFINQMNLSLPENCTCKQECFPNLKAFTFKGNISVTLRTMLDMLDSRRRRKMQKLIKDEEKEDTGAGSGQDRPEYHFSLWIEYLNLPWYQNIKPNKMQNFLRRVKDFATDDVTLDLDWHQPEDGGDEDSDWSDY